MPSRTLARCAAIDDLRAIARARLPRIAFDYLDGGAGDEAAMRRNRLALDAVALTPRALVDVSRCDTHVDLFGRRYAAPIGTAPIGLVNFVTPGGDRQIANAAAALDLPYVLSTAATTARNARAATRRPAVVPALHAARPCRRR
jgi:L-lactate dehydrogenase (cytochrome)/(S)-mandelate dehydrogenase